MAARPALLVAGPGGAVSLAPRPRVGHRRGPVGRRQAADGVGRPRRRDQVDPAVADQARGHVGAVAAGVHPHGAPTEPGTPTAHTSPDSPASANRRARTGRARAPPGPAPRRRRSVERPRTRARDAPPARRTPRRTPTGWSRGRSRRPARPRPGRGAGHRRRGRPVVDLDVERRRAPDPIGGAAARAARPARPGRRGAGQVIEVAGGTA